MHQIYLNLKLSCCCYFVFYVMCDVNYGLPPTFSALQLTSGGYSSSYYVSEEPLNAVWTMESVAIVATSNKLTVIYSLNGSFWRADACLDKVYHSCLWLSWWAVAHCVGWLNIQGKQEFDWNCKICKHEHSSWHWYGDFLLIWSSELFVFFLFLALLIFLFLHLWSL